MADDDILSEIESDNKRAQVLTEDRLTKLRTTAALLRDKQMLLAGLLRDVIKVKEEIRILEDRELVAQMGEAKIKTFDLEPEGNYPACHLSTSNYFSADIPEGGEDAAFKLLVEFGYGDTIQNTMTIDLDPEGREVIMKAVEETDCEFTEKRTVHGGTLKRIIRELHEADKLVATDARDPLKILGAYVGTRVVLKAEGKKTNGKR
jgi:hypothetical protein